MEYEPKASLLHYILWFKAKIGRRRRKRKGEGIEWKYKSQVVERNEAVNQFCRLLQTAARVCCIGNISEEGMLQGNDTSHRLHGKWRSHRRRPFFISNFTCKYSVAFT